jgi:hypothetical protein
LDWVFGLKTNREDAKDAKKEVEVAQAVFEIEAMLLAANFLFVMMNDPIHLTQACRGVENVLARSR